MPNQLISQFDLDELIKNNPELFLASNGGSRLKDYKDLIARYINMQNDQLRNMWYLKCFANCIKDKDCVEIGTGLGVLSSIALGFEPRSLIAYEGSRKAYDIAKQCMNKNIDLRNITVENVYQNPLDPTPDVIFHEMLGDRIWDEGCNLFLPYGVTDWKPPTWLALPGEFITEVYVTKKQSGFAFATDPNDWPNPKKNILIDPGASTDLEWLQKLKNIVYPMFNLQDDNVDLLTITDNNNLYDEARCVAKCWVDVNKGTMTTNGTEVTSFADIEWNKDTAMKFDFDVEKDSFVFFRFGMKYRTSIFYLDTGHWDVCKIMFKIKKDTNVKIDQKFNDGEIGIEVEGKRHIV